MTQHVYVTNHLDESIFVLAAESKEWTIADFVTDIALLAVGLGELKAAATAAAGLPETIATVRDLVTVLKFTATALSGTVTVTGREAEAVHEIVEAFKRNSTKIKPRDHKDVRETGALAYLSPSGIAGLLGADTITLVILADHGKKVAMFDTNIDHSWITTDSRVVRSRYGTLNDEDPSAGHHKWKDGSEND